MMTSFSPACFRNILVLTVAVLVAGDGEDIGDNVELRESLLEQCQGTLTGCSCVIAGECSACDAFEISAETEEDDPGWCEQTGFKQLIHCTNNGNMTVGTYQSCSMEASDRNGFIKFGLVCLAISIVGLMGVQRRRHDLNKKVEQKLLADLEEV
eukprot:m.52339 g.52339  ORF g.52339 m.52339 type:complete len:154 (-) comp10786_c2_seq1:179-640(-)